jgi:hypothetical protein
MIIHPSTEKKIIDSANELMQNASNVMVISNVFR